MLYMRGNGRDLYARPGRDVLMHGKGRDLIAQPRRRRLTARLEPRHRTAAAQGADAAGPLEWMSVK
jgi:hypothetical protein